MKILEHLPLSWLFVLIPTDGANVDVPLEGLKIRARYLKEKEHSEKDLASPPPV